MKKLLLFISGLVLAVAPGAAMQEGKKGLSPEAMFKRMDTNADGKVEKSEFMARGDAQKREKAFSRIDANGDGSISLDEFKAVAERRAKRTEKQ